MRGFLAYVIGAASVAALIPWPEYWPAAVAGIGIAFVLVIPEPDRIVVAEQLDEDGAVVTCWTSERPGVTGPCDLEETAHRLDPGLGWRVRFIPRPDGGKRSRERGV